MRKIFVVGALTLLVAALVKAASRDKAPLPVVSAVDFNRYAGRWYEIARLPNRFENKCAADVTATYTVRADGQIDVVNECRKKSGGLLKAAGRARVADKRGPNTKLDVRFAPAWLSFLPFVWGDYWITELAPDYSYAVIAGGPSRKYFWLLARTPQLDDTLYQSILTRAAAQGFDTARLIKTKQAN